jgi:hypothetical protein
MNGTIPATSGAINSAIEPLTTLCSTNPDATTRNTAFILLSQFINTLPSSARLAVFTELLSPETDPFPQMRVAAVGLVKDSVLAALATLESGKGDDPLASGQLLTQLGRYILRSEPPDLLSRPRETFDVDAFFESSEPVRLTGCLGLYYALLMGDRMNKVCSGVCANTKRRLTSWFVDRDTGPRYCARNRKMFTLTTRGRVGYAGMPGRR